MEISPFDVGINDYCAWESGKYTTIPTNPYEENTAEWFEWEKGYMEAVLIRYLILNIK